MRKKLLILLFTFFTLTAWSQEVIQEPKILDNTYVSVGASASTPLDFNNVFPINSQVSVGFGKEITPVVGFNVEGTAWFGSHHDILSKNRFDRIDAHNAIRGTYLGINNTINLTNLLCGYLGTPRKFEVQTVAGLGWWHVYRPHMSDKGMDDLGAKTGLNLNFNCGDKHTFYIQPAVLWNLQMPASHYDRIAFNRHGAELALGIGYIYHFKTSNGTHSFKKYDLRDFKEQINWLSTELEKKPTEVIVERFINKPIINPYVIEFAQDKSELTGEAKYKLDQIPTEAVVDVVATASPEGSPEYNVALSERRAAVVADYLTKRGVKVESAVGRGVEKNESNRLAFIFVL